MWFDLVFHLKTFKIKKEKDMILKGLTGEVQVIFVYSTSCVCIKSFVIISCFLSLIRPSDLAENFGAGVVVHFR